MSPCRIVLADDHALFRQGIRKILQERQDLEVVGEAADGLELLDVLKRTDADLVLLDIAMPRIRGLEAAKEARLIRPRIKVLLLTMHRNTAYFRYAASAGVEGYLLKEDADTELFCAIDTIRQGRTYISPLLIEDLAGEQNGLDLARPQRPEDPLTVRERQIVKLIAEGRSSGEIADLLHISIRTVQNHRANIMRKLKARRTADLVRYALNKRYTDP